MEVITDLLCELIAGDTTPLYRKLYDAGLVNSGFSGEMFSGDGYASIIFSGETKDPDAVHVVDVSGSEGRDPKQDFEKINEELARFSPALAARPQIVAANKCDIASEEQIEAFRAFIEEKGLRLVLVSAATGKGIDKLPGIIYEQLRELPPVEIFTPDYIKPVVSGGGREFTAQKEEDGSFTVTAPWLERILEGSNMWGNITRRTQTIAALREELASGDKNGVDATRVVPSVAGHG